MNQRIKQLRKKLGLTLEKFGEHLGVKKSILSQIENGKSGITEQMQKAICREFNVNPNWLITGEGEMFLEKDDDICELIDEIMTGENKFHKKAFRSLAKMNETELNALECVIKMAAKFYTEEISSEDFPEMLKKNLSKIYQTHPNTPEELEAQFPPIDSAKHDVG